MADLKELENKAWGLAAGSTDPDALLKAAEAAQKIRELRREKRAGRWSAALPSLTALLAVLLTALTLCFQIVESRKSSLEKEDSEEDQHWAEVLKDISLKDPASVQVGAFGLQSFFESNRHGRQAREIATTILPLVDSNTGFQVVWTGLVRSTRNEADMKNLIAVAREVAYNEQDDLSGLKSKGAPEGCPTEEVGDFMNKVNRCFPFRDGVETPEAKRGWLLSWEIDSISNALARIWHEKRNGITPAGADLSALIFVNANDRKANFEGVDFSQTQLNGAYFHLCDIAGADFQKATLDTARFHAIVKFEGSKWDNADWWNATKISCGLLDYLKKTYPAAAESHQEAVAKLHAACQP